MAECRDLGPVRYRWNTLFAASNLALETPAYCAAARTRLRSGWHPEAVKRSVFSDMMAAMADGVDSVQIHRALVADCPEVISQPPEKPGTHVVGDPIGSRRPHSARKGQGNTRKGHG